jgi:hypothetical protein
MLMSPKYSKKSKFRNILNRQSWIKMVEKQRKVITPFHILLVLLFASFLTIAGWLWSLDARQVLPSGMKVAGWDVGGMSYKAFKQQWGIRLDALSKHSVELQSVAKDVPSGKLTLAQLGLQTDTAQLNSVMDRLFSGSGWDRLRARYQNRNSQVSVPLVISTERLTEQIEKSWKMIYASQPMPAKRIITERDEILYEQEKAVPRIDIAALKSKLEDLLPHLSALYLEPSEGEALGTDPTGNTIILQLPVYLKMPNVTINTLKAQGIDRKFIAFTTPFKDQQEGRIYNVDATAKTINDMLLRPGEIFDYAAVIAKTERVYGYRPAKVIVDGKLVPGIGGGICQVSTTLYNAILRSGIEVIERRNHTLPISYAELGQDATFATGHINFKFRNNTGAYLLIRTEVNDKGLTIKLFGRIPADITYEITSNVLEQIQPTIRYVNNPNLRNGKTITIAQGKPGYKVETFRETKKNGIVLKRERISLDTYAAQPKIIAVNQGKQGKIANELPQSPSSQKKEPPQVEDGVKGPAITD